MGLGELELKPEFFRELQHGPNDSVPGVLKVVAEQDAANAEQLPINFDVGQQAAIIVRRIQVDQIGLKLIMGQDLRGGERRLGKWNYLLVDPGANDVVAEPFIHGAV